MTISEKQLEANRKNGKLGGVKTDAGKSVSRLNALKHGLLSEVILLPEEDEAALLELGKKIRTELKPLGELELALTDRIVSNLWRLRRALKAEMEMMDDDCDPSSSFDLDQNRKSLGKAFSIDFNGSDSYGKFIRYEASIERGLYKALHELQRLQAARNGQVVPLPAAVDVSFPTS